METALQTPSLMPVSPKRIPPNWSLPNSRANDGTEMSATSTNGSNRLPAATTSRVFASRRSAVAVSLFSDSRTVPVPRRASSHPICIDLQLETVRLFWISGYGERSLRGSLEKASTPEH